jgi:hypothetical protein
MSRITYAERRDRFRAALAAAAKAADADQRLATMLADPALDRSEQINVAVALGETHGSAGSAALRQAFSTAMADMESASKSTRSWYRDLVCASLVALARRERPAATDIYLAAVNSPNTIVRDYGMLALAPFGDDRAWEQILARLSQILQRKINPKGMSGGEAFNAIEYLARHAGLSSDRAVRLVTLLRNRWRQFADDTRLAKRIERCWPGIQPGGPLATDLDLPSLHTPRLNV